MMVMGMMTRNVVMTYDDIGIIVIPQNIADHAQQSAVVAVSSTIIAISLSHFRTPARRRWPKLRPWRHGFHLDGFVLRPVERMPRSRSVGPL